MPDALNQTLVALANLSGADRNAILRQLSPEERTALAKATCARAEPAPSAPAASKPATPMCSPWLAKRLAQLMEDRDAAITSATRAALRDLLSEAAR